MKNILVPFVCGLLLLSACTNDKKISGVKPGAGIQLDSIPGSCPYLANDSKGNIYLSWVRMTDDSSASFCYAVSSDGGNSFGKTIIIPSSNSIQPHSENLPKIIVRPSGVIMALWGAANPNPKNKYSGLVFYSQSVDEGKTWSTPKPLVSDTASYDQRYYDVGLLPGNEIGVIWLDNRKSSDKEGSGLYFAVTEGNNGFQHEKRISEQCCQCCRTDLFVDSKGGIHALYRGIINDSIRDMVHIVSDNGGKNFSSAKRISNDNWVIKGCPHTGPSMAENKDGLHFAWFTGGANKGCFYTQSVNNGNSFSQHDRISLLGSHPQISSFPNGDLIIAWDESVQINSKYYKRIGVQKRTASGSGINRFFITPDTLNATYPVVETLNESNFLIAYTLKKGNKNYIMYQQVKL